MIDQQLHDLQVIIGEQEEELRQARSREVALQLRIAKLERVRTAARARLHMWTRETYLALVEALEASDE